MPLLGYVVQAFDILNHLAHTSNAYSFNVYGAGSYPVWEHLITMQNESNNESQNVGVGETYMQFTIPYTEFSNSGLISISASNSVGTGGFSELDKTGASATIPIEVIPAYLIGGTAYGDGGTLPGATVTVLCTNNNTAYQVQTNSNGQWRFFAKPGDSYSISGSIYTSYGNQVTATYSPNPFTCPQNENGNLNINLPLPISDIYGYTYKNGGGPMGGVTIKVTEPSGSTYTTYSSLPSGKYGPVIVSETGTYTIAASASGYYSQSTSQDVSMNASHDMGDFEMTPVASGGGGGGCILYGSLVSLADGQKVPVQDLAVGEQVLSYDILSGNYAAGLSTSALTTGTIRAITITYVTQIVDINNGLLFVSGMTDQPLFAIAQNGTAMPVMLGQLNTSMELYDALNNTFIPITSLTILTGNFTVYDVVTSSSFAASYPQANNYVTGAGVPMILKR